jgi:hypothetical protein
MNINVTWTHLNPSRPTIYTALKLKLGREPSHRELCDDVRRILTEGLCEMAGRGQLRWQRA